MTRVLVTGTDREIGKAILPRLVKHDLTPVAAVGDPAGPVMSIDHDLIVDGRIDVELDTHSTIRTALEGVDVVIHAADVRPGGNDDIADSMRALATACVDLGTHLMLISRVGADLSSLSHRKNLWKAEQVIEQTEGPRIHHPAGDPSRTDRSTNCCNAHGSPSRPQHRCSRSSPADIAGRVVGLAQVGPSQRVRDYGGPELMRFADVAHIYQQVRGKAPRKVPLPKIGQLSEALAGVHVTETGDRGTETFRNWLKNNPI